MTCRLSSILAIYAFPEAYLVESDGTLGELVNAAPPTPYQPSFIEFYCKEHDCSFKQWHAVLSHLGMPMAD